MTKKKDLVGSFSFLTILDKHERYARDKHSSLFTTSLKKKLRVGSLSLWKILDKYKRYARRKHSSLFWHFVEENVKGSLLVFLDNIICQGQTL